MQITAGALKRKRVLFNQKVEPCTIFQKDNAWKKT